MKIKIEDFGDYSNIRLIPENIYDLFIFESLMVQVKLQKNKQVIWGIDKSQIKKDDRRKDQNSVE